ncbi:DUF2252 domain-containing protein [Dapis sp. BLCC M172]|uniref:DUF2252 domain-containing protein n=1 Tax=Dapis sp. BLCC M172 TaxID=2975281 RepID=UPI003CF0B96C
MMNQLNKIFRSGLIVIILILTINCFFIFNNTLAQPINNSQRNQKVLESIELDTDLILSGANLQQREELKSEKYARMSQSPFTFYRATNSLFWQDFVNDSRLDKFGNPKTKTWILGDCHVDNFGAYNNNKGEIIFDLNDFDESIVADYQYDLWRLATSIILVAEENYVISKSEQEEIIDSLSESYLDTLESYAGNDDETQIYFTEKNTSGEVKKTIEKAAEKTRQGMLDKWSKVVDGKRIFDSDNEDLGIASDAKKAIESEMLTYGKTLSGNLNYDPKYFQVKDVAQRLNAGLGSLGTPRYYLLIEGETDDLDDDYILDIKRQYQPPTYELFSLYDRLNYDSIFDNTAQRQAIAYKALIKHADDFLGWMKLVDNNPADGDFSGDYSVREISPYKKSLKTKKLKDKDSFIEVAQQWGKILATDHARADQDFDEKLVPYSFEKQVTKITDGKHKEFQELVREVAFQYAEQVKIDYRNFVNR